MAEAAKPRLLLTGATGFVGRQLRQQLGSGFELHCTSRGPGESIGRWHRLDLRDPDASIALIETIRPEVLVHAAWNTQHGEFWEAKDNDDWLAAGRALFSAFARVGGRRIVACGSCAEYPGAGDWPRREGERIPPSAPATGYGRAKLALLEYLRDLPVEYAWARIFLAYGPHEDERRFVPSVARALLNGRPARCSFGGQVRDFIDVRELGRAIALLVRAPLTGVINLGQGKPVSIAEAACLLGAIAGKPELIELGALPDRPGEAPLLVPDLTRQTDELHFHPGIDLRTGLGDALEFWSTRNSSCLQL